MAVRFLIYLPSILFLLSFLTHIYALPTFTAYLGANLTVPFLHTLRNEDSTYNLEMFTINIPTPFYTDGVMNLGSLQSSQIGRFMVNLHQKFRNLTINLHIIAVETIDSDVYIVSIQETNGPKKSHFIYDAYVEVIQPPSKAECQVQPSQHTPEFLEVSCHAAVGSDPGGNIVCYQDSVKALYSQSTELDKNQITAKFWVNPLLPINCCSHESSLKKDPSSCSDFTQTPDRITTTSAGRMSEVSITITHQLPIFQTMLVTGAKSASEGKNQFKQRSCRHRMCARGPLHKTFTGEKLRLF